eukprot:jgi/Botrbrau1/5022/Bobra.0396s0036.1
MKDGGEAKVEDLDVPPGFEDVADDTPEIANGSEEAQEATGTVPDKDADKLEAQLGELKVEEAKTDVGQVDVPEKDSNLHDTPEDAIRTVPAGDTPYTSASSFDDLPIPKPLLQGLYTEMKFEKPSRIQATTLPMILTPPFRSLIAQAHNGSGKTTCFILGMLARVDPNVPAPQALCVCPTRELVVQNLMVLERMAKFTKITATSTAASDFEFSRNTRIVDQVVIGTHGKLKNWMMKRILQTKNIRILVFDEADEMLKTDAFASDSVRMINQLRAGNPDLQILLFSATFNEQVKGFAMKVVKDANQVFVPREQLSLEVIKQYRVYCPKPLDKVKVLKDMIFPQCEKLGQTIIFVRTRETARALHSAMEREGHRCTSIEGSMEKSARDAVVQEFRDGTTKILISTDVLSRGFDVTQVTLVINYDVPTERDYKRPAFETYLHRIGRSGRFGRRGAAFNLICGPAEKGVLDAIQDYFQVDIPEVPHDDEDAFLDVLKKAGLTDGF